MAVTLLSLAPPADYLQAVQATSVLACIFCCISLLVFIAQLFTLPKGQKFIVSGVLQFLACKCWVEKVCVSVCLLVICFTAADFVSSSPGLFIMIAASIYTDRFHNDETNGNYGPSYILAWIAFGLTFFSAIIYVVLRKKWGHLNQPRWLFLCVFRFLLELHPQIHPVFD